MALAEAAGAPIDVDILEIKLTASNHILEIKLTASNQISLAINCEIVPYPFLTCNYLALRIIVLSSYAAMFSNFS